MAEPIKDDELHDLVAPGQAAGPQDSMRLIAQGGTAVQNAVAITGKEKFEFMVLYCLRLLDQSKGNICAFYLEDFDDCDEHTMRVIQKLIGRSGYTISDYKSPDGKVYKGFWAWRKKEGTASPAQPNPQPPPKPQIRDF
jgi:hypothetical protein